MIRPIHFVPILVALSVCHAEQFVLFDVTFTYTKADADNSTPSKSHYYVRGDNLNADRPRDWTSPVDYRNGTVHIRTEVLEKPEGGEPTTWTLCYIPNRGQGNGCQQHHGKCAIPTGHGTQSEQQTAQRRPQTHGDTAPIVREVRRQGGSDRIKIPLGAIQRRIVHGSVPLVHEKNFMNESILPA